MLDQIERAKALIPTYIQQSLDWRRKRDDKPQWWPSPESPPEIHERYKQERAEIAAQADKLKIELDKTGLLPLLDELRGVAEAFTLDSTPLLNFKNAALRSSEYTLWGTLQQEALALLERLNLKATAQQAGSADGRPENATLQNGRVAISAIEDTYQRCAGAFKTARLRDDCDSFQPRAVAAYNTYRGALYNLAKTVADNEPAIGHAAASLHIDINAFRNWRAAILNEVDFAKLIELTDKQNKAETGWNGSKFDSVEKCWRDCHNALDTLRYAIGVAQAAQQPTPAQAADAPAAQQPTVPRPGRRGRLPKDDSDAKRVLMLATIREHQSLKFDLPELARIVGVSEATLRRWLEDEDKKYRDSQVAKPSTA